MNAQEDDFRKVIASALYDQRISDKIFFEYREKGITTFMNGYEKGMKGVFILPDTNVQKHYPNILDLVGTSHATERYFMTMTLLSHPSGNIYVSSHIMDPAILIWVNFDQIFITKKNAILDFHTTSWSEITSMQDGFVTVECELKKRRGTWKIVSLKIEPKPCCSRLW